MRSEPSIDELRRICRDQEQRLAEQEREVRMLSEALARAESELERYVYIVSHDLKEPLRTVSGFSTLLQRRLGETLEGDARQYLAFIDDGVQRMQVLLDALLDYSRAGRPQQAMQPVALERPLQVALTQLAPAITAAGADVDSAALPEVQGDPVRLAQLFRQLLANALTYRAEGALPQIRIRAEEAGDHWRIAVADNGIGIDPRHQERIFEVFQRLHSREEYPGIGMGLAICKKIVESHGGRLWVESTPGEGATFFFTLPQADRSAAAD